MMTAAKLLREEGYTQTQIGKMLGVAQNTVAVWFGATSGGSNINVDTTSKPLPDSRVKVPPQRYPEISERIAAGCV
jgi:hypothetical protein